MFFVDVSECTVVPNYQQAIWPQSEEVLCIDDCVKRTIVILDREGAIIGNDMDSRSITPILSSVAAAD